MNLTYSDAMAFIWSKLKLLKCQNVFNSFDILTIGQTASETDVSKRLSTLIAQKGSSGSLDARVCTDLRPVNISHSGCIYSLRNF